MLIKNKNQRLTQYYHIINIINNGNIEKVNNQMIDDIFNLIKNKELINLKEQDESNILCFLINQSINQDTIDKHNEIINFVFDADNLNKIKSSNEYSKKSFLNSIVTNNFIRQFILSTNVSNKKKLTDCSTFIIRDVFNNNFVKDSCIDIECIEYEDKKLIVLNVLYKLEFKAVEKDNSEIYKSYANKFIQYIEIDNQLFNLTINDNNSVKEIQVRKIINLDLNVNINELINNFLTQLDTIHLKYQSIMNSYTTEINSIFKKKDVDRQKKLYYKMKKNRYEHFDVNIQEHRDGYYVVTQYSCGETVEQYIAKTYYEANKIATSLKNDPIYDSDMPEDIKPITNSHTADIDANSSNKSTVYSNAPSKIDNSQFVFFDSVIDNMNPDPYQDIDDTDEIGY